jgi:O-antigen/teichoic acid export membrane protein
MRLVLGLTVTAWMARYLGPTQYGELAYVLAFLAFFQAVATLGADAIVVRDIARHPEAAPEVLGTTHMLRLMIGVACWVVAVSFVAVVDQQFLGLVAVAGACLVFQSADTVDLWFQSQSASRRTVVAKLWAYLVSNAVKVVLVLAHAPLMAFAAAIAADALLAAVALHVAYRRSPAAGPWRWVGARARLLLHECWPLLVSSLTIIVYMRIDQIMIRQLIDERSLGVYSAALSLSNVWHVLPVIASTSLMPIMSGLRASEHGQHRRLHVLIFRYHAIAGVTVAVVTAVLAPVLIRWIYGAAYSQAVPVLQVHVFSNLFVFLGVSHSIWMTSEGRSGVRLVGSLTAGAFSIVANYLLLPRHGVVAAAVVGISSQAIAAVGINYFVARESFWMQMEALGLRRRATEMTVKPGD